MKGGVIEDENIPEAGPVKSSSARTGDDIPVVTFIESSLLALAGLVLLGYFGRKKEKEKRRKKNEIDNRLL